MINSRGEDNRQRHRKVQLLSSLFVVHTPLRSSLSGLGFQRTVFEKLHGADDGHWSSAFWPDVIGHSLYCVLLWLSQRVDRVTEHFGQFADDGVTVPRHNYLVAFLPLVRCHRPPFVLC